MIPLMGYALLLVSEGNYYAPMIFVMINMHLFVNGLTEIPLTFNSNFFIGTSIAAISIIALIFLKIEQEGKSQLMLREYNQKNYFGKSQYGLTEKKE